MSEFTNGIATARKILDARCPTCGKNAANADTATIGVYGESMAERYCCLEFMAELRYLKIAAGGVG